MELFLQLAANGLAVGSMYAIYGLSFGLIYAPTRVFHFAHGTVYAAAAYAIYVVAAGLKLPLLIGLLAGLLVAVVLGLGCELLIYRPLRRRGSPPMMMLAASLGLFLVMRNLFIVGFGGEPRVYTTAFFPALRLGPVSLTVHDLARIATALLLFLALVGFLYRSRLGRATRAVVNNPTMARVVGIDIDCVYLWSYAIGSAMLAPIAFINLIAKGANPDMGLPVMLSAAIAVFVGGLGFIPGALAAGLLVGVLENVGVFWTGSEWQSTISFAVLIAFLLWRPNGFFGERMRRVQV